MVFSTPLKLPSDFFCNSTDSTNPSMLVSHLQSLMKITTALPTCLTFPPNYFSKDVTTYTHVFVILWDSCCTPFIQTNSELFPVTKINLSLAELSIPDTVSTEQLNVAFLDSAYKIGDPFFKTPFYIHDTASSLENGCRKITQTNDPCPAQPPPSVLAERFWNPIVQTLIK